VKEYIKHKFGVTKEIGTPDPLMKNHVRIQQLISDMNKARIRDPFQYTINPVWVSPSGDSHLLDDVFHDDEGCVKALFNEGVFNKNCIPGKTDSAEALVAKFDKLDMFDAMYVHVKKDQERLNASAYTQPRRCVYGVINSENLSVDGTSVANLYHYPINNRIAKSMCVPMPSYTYEFMKMICERTRDLMPIAARDIPPNHCSQQFYFSKFKGGLNKHRDVKKKKDGTSQFLPGSPIATVTLAHPMLFEVYAPVDKDKKETYSSNAVTNSHKNMISDILMTHGQVLIWQARDDERYMHALRFEKEDLKKIWIVYSVCLLCSGGWSVEANTTLMDQMMGIQWKNRN
jgi:hypothetical protein